MSARTDTRQRLLDEGRRIAQEKGLRALTVRELAARTEINLGSFVYHFGTRDRFITELVELWYAPMFARLQGAAAPEGQASAFERLHGTLSQLMVFVGDNAGFISHLLADALAEESAVIPFLLSMPGRHPKLLMELTAEAQKEGSLIKGRPRELLLFIVMSVGLPMLLAEGSLKGLAWLPEEGCRMRDWMRDPKAAQLRLTWALKGISTPRGNP